MNSRLRNHLQDQGDLATDDGETATASTTGQQPANQGQGQSQDQGGVTIDPGGWGGSADAATVQISQHDLELLKVVLLVLILLELRGGA